MVKGRRDHRVAKTQRKKLFATSASSAVQSNWIEESDPQITKIHADEERGCGSMFTRCRVGMNS
jgi:hypothetical protein